MSKNNGGKGTQSFSSKMKAVGRGVAKAEMQAASKDAKTNQSPGGGGGAYGGGIIRGTGSQTTGKKWAGVR